MSVADDVQGLWMMKPEGAEGDPITCVMLRNGEVFGADPVYAFSGIYQISIYDDLVIQAKAIKHNDKSNLPSIFGDAYEGVKIVDFRGKLEDFVTIRGVVERRDNASRVGLVLNKVFQVGA